MVSVKFSGFGADEHDMRSFALAVIAMVFLAAGLAGTTYASSYPPGGPSVTVTPATVSPAGSVTVTANCTPGESVTITLESSSTTAACLPDGDSSLSGIATGVVTAPSTPGPYTGTVIGSVSGPLGTFDIVVQSAATPPPGGLPATGSGTTGATAAVAAVLLLVGLGLFAVATVRRTRIPTVA